MSTDAPITRITSLEFTPDENVRYNGMFVPQLDPIEIANIPVDESKIGGIIYNNQSQELQYLAPTFNWINITTDLADPTFTDLTVLNNTTLANLTTSGTTTFNTLTVSVSADINNLNVGNDLIVTDLTTTQHLHVTDDARIDGIIYGKRPGGGVYSNNIAAFAYSGTPIKIPGTTTTAYANGFVGSNNRLTFVPTDDVTFVTMLVSGFFTFTYSVNAKVSLMTAINDQPLNPTSEIDVVANTIYTIPISGIQSLTVNGGNGEYIELWVSATANGTFCTGSGHLTLNITQT